MEMGPQIRTGKRLPDTGKRFRDRIWAYDGIIRPNPVSEFPISIGKSFSGADLYPHFHFQITVEPPRLIFFLSRRKRVVLDMQDDRSRPIPFPFGLAERHLHAA